MLARTVYANERMAQMLGCSPAYLLDRSVNDFVYPEDETGHIAHLQKNLQGHVEQFDTRFRRADGGELLVLGCTSPVRDSNGEVVGALGMFTDITARLRSEREREDLLARERAARQQAEAATQIGRAH